MAENEIEAWKAALKASDELRVAEAAAAAALGALVEARATYIAKVDEWRRASVGGASVADPLLGACVQATLASRSKPPGE